ncbi:MAG: hypothetical protein RL071_3690 [Pseudomonadota bacterium]
MGPDPADMLLLCAVVREGGLSAAGRALGLTRQRVSQRLARLEAALGARLLERTTRQVRLTEVGLEVHRRGEAIEAQLREAAAAVQAAQQQVVGRLRVSAPTLLGRRVLTPLVSRFLLAHPAVALTLTLADRRVNLIADEIDLAIRVGALDDSSFAARKIGEAQTIFVASPGLLAGRPPPSPATLGAWPRLVMREGERWDLPGAPLRAEARLVVNDLELLCAAAVAGLGLARLPLLACGPALQSGALVQLFDGAEGARAPIHALFPSRSLLPLRVRLFIDLLVEHLAAAEVPGLRAVGGGPGSAALLADSGGSGTGAVAHEPTRSA